MTDAILWCAVFLSTTAADIAWTRYFIETEKRHAVKAGAWSALIVAFGLFGTSLFIDNRWLASAGIVGGFFGTWITIKLAKK